MKNKIIGVGVAIFIFIFVVIWIGTHLSAKQFSDVTEIHITITDNTFIDQRTTKSLVINNPDAIKELIKPFKKFELINKNSTQSNTYVADYEIKMNNGYTLTFTNDWDNFDKVCHATFNGTDLEQCAPKEFVLLIKSIIEQNS